MLLLILDVYKRQILCLWKLLRMRDVFDLTLHYLKPCSAPIANIIRIGVPSGITHAIFSVAMLVVQSLTNSFGEMVIACNCLLYTSRCV